MQRFPEIWQGQVSSIRDFCKIVYDNLDTLKAEAAKGVSQKRILDSIESMLSGADRVLDQMDLYGATDDEVSEVDGMRQTLENASIDIKIHQADPD